MGVLRQNERPCTAWAPKLGLGQKKSTVNTFYVIPDHLTNFEVFNYQVNK